jgi:hypothetical protein
MKLRGKNKYIKLPKAFFIIVLFHPFFQKFSNAENQYKLKLFSNTGIKNTNICQSCVNLQQLQKLIISSFLIHYPQKTKYIPGTRLYPYYK